MRFTGRRPTVWAWAAAVVILAGLAAGIYFYSLAPDRKPADLPAKPYDYYIVVDEASGKVLTYVSSVRVSVGDEYLNEDGAWYVIVRVEENRAYARRTDKQR